MDVSVIIPTKNAGSSFEMVLQAVFSQKTDYRYEVICVDSGSTDGTLDIIRKFPCRLFEIPPEEFGHGKTRRYGAEKGTGEFIVFLTQDALPATDTWLNELVSAVRSDDEIAGGFGIHYPYPGCNILDERDITGCFKGFGETNTVFSLEDRERYEREEGYRHVLAFFSDNNACVRRSVFEKYPYEDVNFAEDQIWMKKMIELGYKKIYCPTAPVYHSHNYPLHTYFKRYFDEHKGLYELHGYLIVKKWYRTVPAALRMTLSDWRYILSRPIGRWQKIKWAWYSLWRDLSHFIAGYIGGRYAGYSERTKRFLDRTISQQYDQRKR